LELIREIRAATFPSSGNAVDNYDYVSQHLLAYGNISFYEFDYLLFISITALVGDALAGSVRFRWVIAEHNVPKSTLIDMLCVYPNYHKRGFAWKLLLHLFRLYLQNNISSQDLFILVPRSSWLEEACLKEGFKKIEQIDTTLVNFDPNTCVLLYMHAASLSNLVLYIESKLTR
jgi:hypothetical protein